MVISPEFERFLPPRELWPTRTYTLPELSYPDRLNPVEELLERQVAAGRGDRTAVLFEDQRISYEQLFNQSRRLAASLQDLGIGPGDRVILRLPNIPPAVVSNFALLVIGAIPVPTSPLFSRTELAHVARDCEAVALIVAAALLGEVEAARDALTTVKHIVVVGGDWPALAERGYLNYAELVRAGREEVPLVRRPRLDPAVLLYTSGTTGLPKGTVHPVEELLIVPDVFGRYGWRVREDDVIGGSAPIAFGAGYSTFITIPYRFGAAASLVARFDPEKMFQTIQDHRVTILTLPPTAYRKMLQVPDAEKYDLSSLRLCTGGGESLTAQTYYDWKARFGLEIFEGFGTTEMMYVFVSNVVNLKAKPGSFGQPVPGYEVKVIDEDGRELPPGEVGLMVARGPTGTLYWRDVEKQRRAVWNGWNRVGDFVYRDEDGYFWFVSREDDIIKTSGYRVGPEEIEETIKQHPAVADVGVVGVPDPVRGQNAKAFVVLKPGYTPEQVRPEDIIEFCRGKIATYKLPREVEFVADLPRTPTGKLLRRLLRAQVEQPAGPGRADAGS